MIVTKISLALCTVFVRRLLAYYSGRLPVVVAKTICPSAVPVAMLSGALIGICLHIRRSRPRIPSDSKTFVRQPVEAVFRQQASECPELRNIYKSHSFNLRKTRSDNCTQKALSRNSERRRFKEKMWLSRAMDKLKKLRKVKFEIPSTQEVVRKTRSGKIYSCR
ncbi:uncharacterized protein LOC132705557 [Cylas formicarius]|uniref:uncharacterized protein LOC132705557 n=1 Tax=Cylas formicarius TaxID=197179 RepID=UPI0029586CCF|nr:uncharacterized protein LOC132705557 [Cylas formicarius]